MEQAFLLCRSDVKLARIDLNEVLLHATIRDGSADGRDEASSGPSFEPFTVSPHAAARTAAPKLRCVYLLLTGYPDGLAREDETPDPEVGPGTGRPLTERVLTLAAREGKGASSIFRWLKEFRELGPSGLVDRRSVRIHQPLGNCPREVAEVIWQVLDRETQRSRHTSKSLVNEINETLNERYGDKVPHVSERSMMRHIKTLDEEFHRHLAKKTLRSNRSRPPTPFHSLVVSRPFEVVEIDSTPLDVLALSPVDGSPISVWLTVALDVYTRLVVAWRITTKDPKGLDAALLLYDMLMPKRWRPEWGEQARWRYGIPESLVLGDAARGPLAGVPFGSPSRISLDNGSIYVSDVMYAACVRLGIDLHFARKGRPTDKPHVERFFGTVKTGLIQYLPGYSGASVSDRGTTANVEDEAYLLPEEIGDAFACWVAVQYHNTPHNGLPLRPGTSRVLTPNEAYDRAIAITGFYAVPASPTLAIELLPGAARQVTKQGVEIFGLHYDSEQLEPYREQLSPYPDHAGKWPIRYDPRDLSGLWFFEPDYLDPAHGAWTRVPCKSGAWLQPFADIELEWVKKRVSDAGYKLRRSGTEALVLEQMRSYLRRISRGQPEDGREAKVAAIGRDRVRLAFAHRVDVEGALMVESGRRVFLEPGEGTASGRLGPSQERVEGDRPALAPEGGWAPATADGNAAELDAGRHQETESGTGEGGRPKPERKGEEDEDGANTSDDAVYRMSPDAFFAAVHETPASTSPIGRAGSR
ncbi:Mu transposase C-terminal domain-containing protein [Georgenia subflava]|nr:Mu transposase C-terminal domain-containing protein [Georgenia subflava]